MSTLFTIMCIEILSVLLLIIASVQESHGSQCSMYGICEKRNGNPFPCAVKHGPRAVETSNLNAETVKSFSQLCPNYNLNQDLCCNHEQIEHLVNTLNGEMKTWFYRCPSCYANIASLYCSVTCDPRQSYFVSTTKLSTRDTFASNVYVSGLESYVEKLFKSCENVRYWKRDTLKAMDLFCEGCIDFEFFKRILRDYPLKPDRTIGITITKDSDIQTQEKALQSELTSCSDIAPGLASACDCIDCGSCPEVTEGSKETTTVANNGQGRKNSKDGKGSGSIGQLPNSILFLFSVLLCFYFGGI